MNLVYTNKCQINQLDYSKLVQEYMPLVQKVAKIIHRKINYSLELDDLVQSGYIGLIESLQRYVPTDKAKFETYATMRIKGNILDDLRKNDYLNQEDRTLYKKIEEATNTLLEKGDKPQAEVIANKCGISLEEYFSVLNKNYIHNFVSYEESSDYLEISNNDNVEEKVKNKEMMKLISKEIKNLPEKEQIIMQLIYIEDLDAKEVAYVMKITPARVSQLHSKALQQIKNNLKQK